MPARSAPDTRAARTGGSPMVGRWRITRMSATDAEVVETAEGKLILDDYWVVVLEQRTLRPVVAVPNTQALKVEPAE